MKSPTPKAGASRNARGPKASNNSTSAASDGGGLERLAHTPYNPRRPWESEQKASDFKRSLEEFGDLSGIVFNVRTGHLVGGNKRTEAFQDAKERSITITSDVSDQQGSVRYGFVLVDGNRFAYREVDWDERKEKAANLAANKWSAEWDDSAVRDIIKELGKEFDVALTGFDAIELAAMNLEPPEAPSEFPIVDQNLPIEHKCPKCGYQWSGKPA